MISFTIYLIGIIVAYVLGMMQYSYEQKNDLPNDRRLGSYIQPTVLAAISLFSWWTAVGLLCVYYKGIWWSFWHWFDHIE